MLSVPRRYLKHLRRFICIEVLNINFDILIQNIPPLLIPDAYLVSLKSELVEYGISVKGRMATSDNFTFTSGNIEIIVPSGTEGEDDTVHEYPFEIESGSPPVLGDVDFLPKGNYGEITFNDVTDAFGMNGRSKKVMVLSGTLLASLNLSLILER